jgi:hypothetical protein
MVPNSIKKRIREGNINMTHYIISPLAWTVWRGSQWEVWKPFQAAKSSKGQDAWSSITYHTSTESHSVMKVQCSFCRRVVKIRALYSCNQCSHLARQDWVYENPEAHFTRQADPRHLENWIALKEARILSQVTHHHQHTRTGQRITEEYFPPITWPSTVIGSFVPQFTLEDFVCQPSVNRPALSWAK